MDVDQIRKLLDPVEQFIHNHSEQFIAKFVKFEDAWDIVNLRFSSEYVEFVFVTSDGQHIIDGIDWADFKEWYNEVEQKEVR